MLNKPLKEILLGITLTGATILILPFGATSPTSTPAETAPPASVKSCAGTTSLKFSKDCYESLLAEGKLPKSQIAIENAVKNLMESSPQIQQLACSLPDRKIDVQGSILDQGRIASTGTPSHIVYAAVANEWLQNPDWLAENGLEPQEGARGLTDAQAAALDEFLAPRIEEQLRPGGKLWSTFRSMREAGSILWESNSGDLLYTKAFTEKTETGDFTLRLDPPINRTGLGAIDPGNANVHTVTCTE